MFTLTNIRFHKGCKYMKNLHVGCRLENIGIHGPTDKKKGDESKGDSRRDC